MPAVGAPGYYSAPGTPSRRRHRRPPPPPPPVITPNAVHGAEDVAHVERQTAVSPRVKAAIRAQNYKELTDSIIPTLEARLTNLSNLAPGFTQNQPGAYSPNEVRQRLNAARAHAAALHADPSVRQALGRARFERSLPSAIPGQPTYGLLGEKEYAKSHRQAEKAAEQGIADREAFERQVDKHPVPGAVFQAIQNLALQAPESRRPKDLPLTITPATKALLSPAQRRALARRMEGGRTPREQARAQGERLSAGKSVGGQDQQNLSPLESHVGRIMKPEDAPSPLELALLASIVVPVGGELAAGAVATRAGLAAAREAAIEGGATGLTGAARTAAADALRAVPGAARGLPGALASAARAAPGRLGGVARGLGGRGVTDAAMLRTAAAARAGGASELDVAAAAARGNAGAGGLRGAAARVASSPVGTVGRGAAAVGNVAARPALYPLMHPLKFGRWSVAAQAPVSLAQGRNPIQDVGETGGVLGQLPGMAKDALGAVPDVLKPVAEDLLDLPAQVVPSLYLPLAGIIEAAGGDNDRLNELWNAYKETGILPAAFSGDLSEVAERFGDHPLLGVLEVSGLKAVVGRGSGAALRAGVAGRPGQRFAALDRESLRRGGNAAPIPRGYSPDLINQMFQKWADRRRGKDMGGQQWATPDEDLAYGLEQVDRGDAAAKAYARTDRDIEIAEALAARPPGNPNQDAVALAMKGLIAPGKRFHSDLTHYRKILDRSFDRMQRELDSALTDQSISPIEARTLKTKIQQNRANADRLAEIQKSGDQDAIFRSAQLNAARTNQQDVELAERGLGTPMQLEQAKRKEAARVRLGAGFGKPDLSGFDAAVDMAKSRVRTATTAKNNAQRAYNEALAAVREAESGRVGTPAPEAAMVEGRAENLRVAEKKLKAAVDGRTEAERKLASERRKAEGEAEPYTAAEVAHAARTIQRRERRQERRESMRERRTERRREAKEKAGYDPAPEAVNEREWYHGSGKRELTPEALDSTVTSEQSLYGPGVYLTSRPNTARGYATARSRGNSNRQSVLYYTDEGTPVYDTAGPAVYRAEVNVRRVIDLDKPIGAKHDADDVAFIQAVAKTAQQIDAIDPEIGPNAMGVDLQGSAVQAVRNALARERPITRGELYGILQRQASHISQNSQLPSYEFADIFHDFTTELTMHGVDAMTHRGGQRISGAAPSQTLIVLDPANVSQHAGRANPITQFVNRRAGEPEAPRAHPVERVPPRRPAVATPRVRRRESTVAHQRQRAIDARSELRQAAREALAAREAAKREAARPTEDAVLAAEKAAEDAKIARNRAKNRAKNARQELGAAQRTRRTFHPHSERLLHPDTGAPLVNPELDRLLRETGLDPEQLGFLSSRPGSRGRGSFSRSYSGGRATLNKKELTGEGILEGAVDTSYEALVEGRVRTGTILNAVKAFDRAMEEHLIKKDNGQPETWTDRGRAEDAARNPQQFGVNEDLVVVRQSGVGLTKREVEKAAEHQGGYEPLARPDENLTADPTKGLTENLWERAASDRGPGPFGLMRKSQFERYKEHAQHAGAQAKVWSSFTSAWKRSILATSPSWVPGNFADINVRTAFSGTNPYGKRAHLARRVYRSFERQFGPEEARMLMGRLRPGMVFGEPRATRRYVGVEQVRGNKVQNIVQKGQHARETEPLHTLIDGYMNFTDKWFDANNKYIERQGQDAGFGKHVQDEISKTMGRWKSAWKISDKAIDEYAAGLINTNNQIKAAHAIEQITGKWTALSPAARSILVEYVPFGQWMRNAFKFAYVTLPKHHPIATAIGAVAYEMTDEERDKLGLSWFAPNALPGTAQGSIPTAGGGLIPVGKFTTFGTAGDPAHAGAGFIPQLDLDALAGIDWTGEPLTHDDGTVVTDPLERILRAIGGTAEAFVPGLTQAKRVADKGWGALSPIQPIDPGLADYLRTLKGSAWARYQPAGSDSSSWSDSGTSSSSDSWSDEPTSSGSESWVGQ